MEQQKISFDRNTMEGDKNFGTYRKLLKKKYTYSFWYLMITLLSVALSLGGVLHSPIPVIGGGLVLIVEGVKLWIADFVDADKHAKMVNFLLILAVVLSFGTSMFTMYSYIQYSSLVSDRLADKVKDTEERIEFLVSRSSNLTDAIGSQQSLLVQLNSAKAKWLRYSSMKMKDWVKNNPNGRKGKRSGDWMVKNSSKCNTPWCSRVIGYHQKYEGLLALSQNQNQQVSDAKSNKEELKTLNARLASLRNEGTFTLSPLWQYFAFCAGIIFTFYIEAIQYLLRGLKYDLNLNFFALKIHKDNWDRKIRVRNKKRANLADASKGLNLPDLDTDLSGTNYSDSSGERPIFRRLDDSMTAVIVNDLASVRGKVTHRIIKDFLKKYKVPQNSQHIQAIVDARNAA